MITPNALTKLPFYSDIPRSNFGIDLTMHRQIVLFKPAQQSQVLLVAETLLLIFPE